MLLLGWAHASSLGYGSKFRDLSTLAHGVKTTTNLGVLESKMTLFIGGIYFVLNDPFIDWLDEDRNCGESYFRGIMP